MKRRTFIQQMILTGVGAYILPSGGRIWRPMHEEEQMWVYHNYLNDQRLEVLATTRHNLLTDPTEPILGEARRFFTKTAASPAGSPIIVPDQRILPVSRTALEIFGYA